MLGQDHIVLLQQHIHRESERWVVEYIQGRKAKMERDGIKASNRLMESLQYEIQDTAADAVTNVLELAFREHGRYVDMRLNPAAGGRDYLSQLAEWIVKKGLYDKFVQRYLDTRNLSAAPADVLDRLAWGMAKKRAMRTPRRRRWYAASSTGAVTDLFNRVAEGLPDIIIQQLKKQFDGSTTR